MCIRDSPYTYILFYYITQAWIIQLNCGKFSSAVISTTGFFKIRMVNLDASTICNGQNIVCRPDILTANRPLSLHYFTLPLNILPGVLAGFLSAFLAVWGLQADGQSGLVNQIGHAAQMLRLCLLYTSIVHFLLIIIFAILLYHVAMILLSLFY